MKSLALAALCLLGCAAAAQTAPKPPYLMEGYGDLHHPVSTAVPEAQQFFDQGLRLDEAAAELAKLNAIEAAQPRDELFMPPVENHTWQIEHLAASVLAARIAEGRGDRKTAIAKLQQAVATQDALLYNEPSDWYYPVRESLGGLLLRTGDNAAAEAAFRKDLELNPRNPRSLFGLSEALSRQKHDYEAAWVKTQFQQAWQGADVPLTVDTLF